MSTFIIISANSPQRSLAVERAIRLYNVINGPSVAHPPELREGSWGTLIYWKGRNERLAVVRMDPGTALYIGLGWNSHTSLAPALLRKIKDGGASGAITPLVEPELSLGIYAILTSDEEAAACVPDPYGTYPVYVSTSGQGLIVSNDPVLSEATAGRRLVGNRVGLIERILTEGNLDCNYPLGGVRRLGPGEWATFSKGTSAVCSYRYSPRVLDKDRMGDLLVSQFKKIGELERPVILKLTGGKDTRLNLAAALEAGMRPLCYTIRSADSTSAGMLSKEYGLLHVHVDASHMPIDPDSEAGVEYMRIRKQAVYITGADGALCKAHYMKGMKPQTVESLEFIAQNYINDKREALLSGKAANSCYLELSRRWRSLDVSGAWWVNGCRTSALYVDRVRTFSGEAWARPSGAMDIPALSGPAMQGYGLGFSLFSRESAEPHIALIRALLGETKTPYFMHKQSFLGALRARCPRAIRVAIWRFVLNLRYARLPDNAKCPAHAMQILAEHLSHSEIARAYVTRRSYVNFVTELLERAQLANELVGAAEPISKG